MRKVRIRELELTDIGGIRSLNVSFNDGLNLLCGTNGVGKTTILEVIAGAFAPNYPNSLIRRRTGSDDIAGAITLNIESGGAPKTLVGRVSAVKPGDSAPSFGSNEETASVLIMRAHRDFGYFNSETINRDPVFNEIDVQTRLTRDLPAEDIKRWFANRYLMSPHNERWPEYRKRNLETAKSLFSLLDSSVSLSHVDTSTFDIYVNTPNGELVFEFLSSGFRSAYYLLLGILKEIEFRNLEVSAEEFSGLLLIDELDLHLHPSWQAAISKALKSTFPNAQIIATTHSPHVIQTAAASEVIALVRDGQGNTHARKLPVNEFGFSGWTIEEILRDVMGMEDTQTREYREAVEAFDTALDSDDEEMTAVAFRYLDVMLHPSNPLRKVLEIQAAAITGPEQ